MKSPKEAVDDYVKRVQDAKVLPFVCGAVSEINDIVDAVIESVPPGEARTRLLRMLASRVIDYAKMTDLQASAILAEALDGGPRPS